MSNFTDFFPGAGGGGIVGGGVSINSYAPYSVSATNNPTGYNATTGLYTHPDGTFWVRTGFQIRDYTSAYPNAKTVPLTAAMAATGYTIPNINGAHGLAYDANDSTLYRSVSGGAIVTQYTNPGGVATGFSFSAQAQVGTIGDIAVGGGNIYVLGSSALNVWEYTMAGVYTGFTFSVATEVTATSRAKGFYYDGTTFVVGAQQITSPASSRIIEYNSSGVYTGFTFDTSPEDQLEGVTKIGTDYIVVGRDIAYFFGFTAAGTAFSLGPQAGTVYSIAYDGTDIIIGSGEQYEFLAAADAVGNPIAKTDTDTAEPLFVRIG